MGAYVQTNFLGGEWAPEVQGRTDSDNYRTGMNKCQNYLPIEQGSLLRRPGTRYVGHTKAGAAGRIHGFDLTGNPLQLEFTAGWIRFIKGSSFYPNGVAAPTLISTATPAVVTTAAAHGFATGDTVFFNRLSATYAFNLWNRQFTIIVLTATTFSIADALTGVDIDGTAIGGTVSAGKMTVTRIAELASPYTGTLWSSCVFIQDEASLIILHPTIPTRVITQVSTGFGFAIGLYTFQDGPYGDINATTTTLTPSAATGSITVTASAVTGINNDTGFQTTDVGRFIRMYNAPAAWDVTKATYAVGDQVLYIDGNSYVALKAGSHQTGVVPTNIDHWALLAFLPYWTWMKITARTSTTVVTCTIQQSTSTTSASLFNILATKIWRLGLYCDTLGWPTCGTYHEGRLWLAGVTVNRLDGSVSNQYGVFSPTGDDGTVSNANAISGVVKANENNPIQWLAADDAGLLFGTTSSEWKIKASNLDDPLTPDSSTPRRLTQYGSTAGAQPLLAHKMHLFIQRMKRKVIELGHPGAEGGALYQAMDADNMSLTGSHLSAGGIVELAWTQEPKPFVWARRADGTLLGMTYIRKGEKVVAGWHSHPLGVDPTLGTRNRLVESISSGPSTDGFTDHLYFVGKDVTTGYRQVEMLTDIFDDNKADWAPWFVDMGIVPASAVLLGTTILHLFGLWPFNDQYVSVVIGGLDCGDHLVTDGGCDVPIDGAPLTLAFITSLNGGSYGDMAVEVM